MGQQGLGLRDTGATTINRTMRRLYLGAQFGAGFAPLLRPHPANQPSYPHPCSAETLMLHAMWWAADGKGTDRSKSLSEYTSAAEDKGAPQKEGQRKQGGASK